MRIERKQQGQEAFEFAIIAGLVFVVSIGVIMVFGEKIANFFQNTPAMALGSHTTPVINQNNFADFKDNTLVTHVEEQKPYETVNIAGRDFNFPTELINTIEAAGIDGGKIYAEIEYLMSTIDDPLNTEFNITHFVDQTKRSGDQVIKECQSGDINRSECRISDINDLIVSSNSTSSYAGTAITNSNVVSIKAGDKIILIDKETDCKGDLCKVFPAENEYRIEGVVGSNGKYVGNVTVVSGKDPGTYKYVADVDLDGELNFENGKMINVDPLLKEIESFLKYNNREVRSVLKDLRDGKNKNYSNSDKQKAKKLITQLDNKYKGMYQVIIDFDNFIGINNEALLIGMNDTDKGILYDEEKNNSYNFPPNPKNDLDEPSHSGGGHAAAEVEQAY